MFFQFEVLSPSRSAYRGPLDLYGIEGTHWLSRVKLGPILFMCFGCNISILLEIIQELAS